MKKLLMALSLMFLLTLSLATPALADSSVTTCRVVSYGYYDQIVCTTVAQTQTTESVPTETVTREVTQATEFVPTETTEVRESSASAPCQVGNSGRSGTQSGILSEEFTVTSTQEFLVTTTREVTTTSTQQYQVNTTTVDGTVTSVMRYPLGSPVVTQTFGDPVVMREAVGDPVITEDKTDETFTATGKCQNISGRQ